MGQKCKEALRRPEGLCPLTHNLVASVEPESVSLMRAVAKALKESELNENKIAKWFGKCILAIFFHNLYSFTGSFANPAH